MAAAGQVSRRDRVRAATVEEIKRTALDLMREQGTTNVRFSDIARAMGMTPPALYRYFADRDELLTQLIVDGYRELGAAVAAARDAVPADDLPGRLLASAQAYRQWARREPQRFALLFGLPVPGYSAPPDGPTSEAARGAMRTLSDQFRDARRRGRLQPPMLRDVDETVVVCARRNSGDTGEEELPPETFQAMTHAWASLHGFVCLEAYGHFDSLDPEARDALFLAQVKLVARFSGLPVPD